MTETQRTLNMLQEVELVVNGLLELEKSEISRGLDDYISLKEKMDFLMRKTRKYKKFLSIKDESRQIYGPKMQDKMRNICQRFETVDEIFEEQLSPVFESIEAEYRKRLMELDLEERKKKEEEFRSRIQKGIQETYLEEKARKMKLKEREEEEAKRRSELDRLTKEENERQNKMKSAVMELEAYIKNLESQYSESITKKDGLNCVLSTYIIDGINKLLLDSKTLKDFYLSLEIISDIIGCVLRDPSDVKFRLIRLNNNSFFHSFGDKKSAILILFGIGFRTITLKERREYYEILSSNDLKLNISHLNTSDPYIVLREPDPIDQYDLWSHWMDELNLINNVIVSLPPIFKRLIPFLLMLFEQRKTSTN